MTAWCKSLIDDGKVEFFCPAIVDHERNEKCNKKWSFDEVKRIGLLNEVETEYFEKMLSENSLKAHVDFKQCPKCRSFIERLNDSNLRVKCTICTKIMGRNYEFCWQCEREWDSASSMTCNEKDTCGKLGKLLALFSLFSSVSWIRFPRTAKFILFKYIENLIKLCIFFYDRLSLSKRPWHSV